MLNMQLYPKAKRIGLNPNIMITEKLDGSNLGFFKKNGELYIAQRSTVYRLSELSEMQDKSYKGLYGWLTENGVTLQESLNEGSCIFGEWIGMGKLKYPSLDHRFYMFAKANIDEDFNVTKLQYNQDNFIYPFVDTLIPTFIAFVPLVLTNGGFNSLSIEFLNQLYIDYSNEVGRNVEGFVVNFNGSIQKYVRMKNGTLTEHQVKGD